jgi:hypothetical protein
MIMLMTIIGALAVIAVYLFIVWLLDGREHEGY